MRSAKEIQEIKEKLNRIAHRTMQAEQLVKEAQLDPTIPETTKEALEFIREDLHSLVQTIRVTNAITAASLATEILEEVKGGKK